MGPEQPGRVRADKQPEAIAAVPKGFKFVEPGVFTVAVSPGGPPLATYATDARTVVGADADFAQLIADSLGLRPRPAADSLGRLAARARLRQV